MSSPPPRVALAAQPQLLADALSVVFAAKGVEVVVGDPTDDEFDLAVVVDPTDCDRIGARLYAILDQSPDSTGGAQLYTAGGRRLGEVDSSDELVMAILGRRTVGDGR